MSRLARLFLVAVVAACNPLPDPDNFPDFEEDEDEDEGLSATIGEVCARMLVCGLWAGPGRCEDDLLDPDSCTLPDRFLGCMNTCIEAESCLFFEDCERLCFEDQCLLGNGPLTPTPVP